MKKELIELMVKIGMLTVEQGETIINSNQEPFIGAGIDSYNDAQLCILLSMGLVERLPAGVEFTNTVLDLQTALSRLGKALFELEQVTQ